jgi:hypothetical protein
MSGHAAVRRFTGSSHVENVAARAEVKIALWLEPEVLA